MIRFLEERALNARPALQTHLFDGWVLRFANGYTRRSNSVNALYESTMETEAKIRYCEELYWRHTLPVVFKITPGSQPTTLDALLDAQGYDREHSTSVQVLDLAQANLLPTAIQPHIFEVPTPEWVEAHVRLNRVEARHVPTMTRIFESIVPPHCFMTLGQDGVTVATGLAVADCGYVKLSAIVTATHLRNRGLGKQMVTHLLRWGRLVGAHHAYLPVETTNDAALHLYASFGFREEYRYWYRVKDTQA